MEMRRKAAMEASAASAGAAGNEAAADDGGDDGEEEEEGKAPEDDAVWVGGEGGNEQQIWVAVKEDNVRDGKEESIWTNEQTHWNVSGVSEMTLCGIKKVQNLFQENI